MQYKIHLGVNVVKCNTKSVLRLQVVLQEDILIKWLWGFGESIVNMLECAIEFLLRSAVLGSYVQYSFFVLYLTR